MATVDVTQENFEQVVGGHDIVIVDFWAPWCGPCRGFAPVYETASEKYPDVVFAKVNTEVAPAHPCARDIHASCISAQQTLAGCSDVHGRTSVA